MPERRVKVTAHNSKDADKAQVCEDYLNWLVAKVEKDEGIIITEMVPIYGEDETEEVILLKSEKLGKS